MEVEVVRVLVCGGRTYRQWRLVHRSLDLLHRRVRITTLIHGDADGGDSLAAAWAHGNGVPEDPYPIVDGEGGYARNGRMLIKSGPDLVVHFPGGNGTADMVAKARAAGVTVVGGLDREGLNRV